MRDAPFLQVPLELAESADPFALAVWVAILSFCDHGKRTGAHPSDPTIAEKAKCSPRKVRDARTWLRAEGWLSWQTKATRKGRVNHYEILLGGGDAAHDAGPPMRQEVPDPPRAEEGGAAGGAGRVRHEVPPTVEARDLDTSLPFASLTTEPAQGADEFSTKAEDGGDRAAPPMPTDPRLSHAYWMPLLRKLRFRADDTDGSVVRAILTKAESSTRPGAVLDSMDAAVRGLAMMRDAGALNRFGTGPEDRLSMLVLHAAKLNGGSERRPIWNDAEDVYQAHLERQPEARAGPGRIRVAVE